jgi:hypothetical protein
MADETRAQPSGTRRLPETDPDETMEVWRYRVHILGTGLSSGPFATYEHAVTNAEQLAAQRRTRLFYAEYRDAQPHLLKEPR